MSTPRRRLAARRRNPETGSPDIGEPVFVLVGILRRPHGLRGEALVSLETDFPERIQKGLKLFLGDAHLGLTVRNRRETREGLILAFEEFSDREALGPYRNEPLFRQAADIPKLPRGQAYLHQLIGLDVLTDDGEWLGKLVEVLDTAANDVYIVRSAKGQDILLPAIRDVIRSVDLVQKRLIVHLLPGLLPEK